MRRLAFGLVSCAAMIGCGQASSKTESLGRTEQALSTGVVISQVYGGGSGAGAAFKYDYVELFNRGSSPVSLGGLSLQYSRADMASWSVLPLPSDTIQPGKYYLIRVFSPVTLVGADLPTPDFTETTTDAGTSANYGTNSGLVAVVNGTTPLACGFDAGPCTSSTIVDFVGYGAGDTVRPPTTYEGSAAAPRPATTSEAVARKGGGCQETDENANDFEIITVGTTGPGPRNSASPANLCTNGMVISQVYGGGSASGATYKYDYVELFNRSSSSVSLTGMSLQYSRADASTWTVLPLPSVVVPPGRYYLIRVFVPATLVGGDLPTPDLLESSGDGGTGVNYGTNSGLVAIVNDTTPLTCGFDAGACTSASIVDFLGYGVGDTVRPPTVYEGTAGPRPASGTQAVFRKNGGCIETNDNGADFEILTPAARNSASPANLCGSVSDAGTDAMPDADADVSVSDADADADATTDAVSDADADAEDATDTGAIVDSASEDTGTAPADTGSPQNDTGTEADTGTAPTDELLEDDGCSCRVPGGEGSRSPASALGIAALAGLVALMRRRR